MDQDPLFDYYAPAFRVDPYAFYRRLREEDPVHWGLPFEPDFDGAWQIARYADVNAMLKDPRLGKATVIAEHMAALPVEAQEYLGLLSLSLLRMDPPDHTRLRALVSKAFTPRMVENLRPRVEAIATQLLDETGGEPELDLIYQYAFPLTITVITEMLGLDYDDRDQLKRWAGVLVAAQECKRTPEIYGPASEASAEVVAFFREQIARQREHPRPGILSDLIAVRDQDGDRLSENGADRHLRPAARRRTRHDGEPDRQWDVGVAAQSRSTGAPARGSRPDSGLPSRSFCATTHPPRWPAASPMRMSRSAAR